MIPSSAASRAAAPSGRACCALPVLEQQAVGQRAPGGARTLSARRRSSSENAPGCARPAGRARRAAGRRRSGRTAPPRCWRGGRSRAREARIEQRRRGDEVWPVASASAMMPREIAARTVASSSVGEAVRHRPGRLAAARRRRAAPGSPARASPRRRPAPAPRAGTARGRAAGRARAGATPERSPAAVAVGRYRLRAALMDGPSRWLRPAPRGLSSRKDRRHAGVSTGADGPGRGRWGPLGAWHETCRAGIFAETRAQGNQRSGNVGRTGDGVHH